jgi:hypothetical protein
MIANTAIVKTMKAISAIGEAPAQSKAMDRLGRRPRSLRGLAMVEGGTG